VRTAAMTLCICLLAACRAWAGEPDEPGVKRSEPFEFARKPKLTREGDRVTIAFESKGFCDATVAVENAEGRIVRHLASGVLGTNAPEPFQKGSLRQTVVWDGKNDKGEYVDDKDRHAVRVSLGLEARFERTMFWSPRKRTSQHQAPLRLAAAPEGVYVYDSGGGWEHLRLYDRDGNYLRTVYPFPADKIEQVEGLTRRVFPGSDRRYPVKWGVTQATMLSWNSQQPLDTWPAGGGHGWDGNFRIDLAGTALAVMSGKVALVGERVNRFATDGTSGGMRVHGPAAGFEIVDQGMPWRGGGRRYPAAPVSAAISPDGRWLYLAGYTWPENMDTAGWRRDWLHGAARLRLDGDEPAKVFAGSLKQHDAGSANGKLSVAACVACDGQGRVYVGDYLNDRVQVFDADGRLLKSIPAAKPARLVIHPKSGEIYVFSWLLRNRLWDKATDLQIKATLTQLGPFENPKPMAAWDLPLRNYSGRFNSWDAAGGAHYDTALDLWSDPPAVWISDQGLRIFKLEAGKLVCKRDFEQDLGKEVVQPRPPYHGRQRLCCDPKSGKLYVAEQHYPVNIHSKAFWDLVCLDPDTGRGKIVRAPCSAEDLAFDTDGYLYLRTMSEIARFDPEGWREVPFDYGVELAQFGYQHGTTRVMSAIQVHGESGPSGQFSGMGVSPKGHVFLTVLNRGAAADRRETAEVFAVKQYTPRIYPGRLRHWEIHVFDKYGKPLYLDAVTGIGYLAGVQMDKDDFLYVQAQTLGAYADGKTHPNPLSCTLLKLDPRKTRIVTTAGVIPLTDEPKRQPDILEPRGWIEGLQWLRPGVGLSGKGRGAWANCHCQADSRFALDLYGRAFASETQSYDLMVLDSNGNVITRIGRYGNVDDGKPLVPAGGPAKARSIGGDEVALMHALYLAVHTDRRLFAADLGNARILSVKLGYRAEERVALKDAG